MSQHPEIEERQKEEARKTQEREYRIINEFMPVVEKSASDLLTAGKVSQGLAEIVQMGMNNLAQKTKVKDLGLSEHLDKFIAGDPKKADKFKEQKELLEQLGEWTVSEFMYALNWLGFKANQFTERSISGIKIKECFDEIKKHSKLDTPQPVPTPYQDDLGGKDEKEGSPS